MSIADAELLVFTEQDSPIYNIPANTQIIRVDSAQKMHEQFSANLPSNQAQAESVARSRLEIAGRPFQQFMQEALQGEDAWDLGIAKLPAIVVDRKYVIYGE